MRLGAWGSRPPAHPAALCVGLFTPNIQALVILQQAEECTVFSFKPQLLHMAGKKPSNPLTVYFRFSCPAFRLGRCAETVQSSPVSNSTITRQKPSLALIIPSPDSGSWSFKDKIQTAHDSVVQASASCTALHCPAQELAFVNTLCFNSSCPFMLNTKMFCSWTTRGKLNLSQGHKNEKAHLFAR